MRLVLFSGLGGDHRLTRPVVVPGVEVLTPDHLEPLPGERLPAYARRAADAAGLAAGDAVGGVSFGGMIAAEVARQREVAALVLLGTCVRPRRLPASYRLLEKIGPLLPDAVLGLRTWAQFVRRRFAPMTPEGVAVLQAMAADCPPARIRAFGRMLMDWDGVEAFGCPVLSIHGDRDAIIPLSCAEPGLVLKEAGHSFTLTHASQTAGAIAAFLAARGS
ncbi:MAG: alpha/beta fold hydrolase [Elusimicrobiota bacterium]|nr:alpha/beta fold hydrolase [Elusimicrobiota bacterium]